jgi:translation initiation factor 6 (eIF-6)
MRERHSDVDTDQTIVSRLHDNLVHTQTRYRQLVGNLLLGQAANIIIPRHTRPDLLGIGLRI